MKIKVKVKFTVETDGEYVIAPNFVDMYQLGFIQAGTAKEGYRKWKRKEEWCHPRYGLHC